MGQIALFTQRHQHLQVMKFSFCAQFAICHNLQVISLSECHCTFHLFNHNIATYIKQMNIYLTCTEAFTMTQRRDLQA